MKNSILLLISALVLSAFWSIVYIFAENTLAISLALLFGLISLIVGFLIILKTILLITGQSRSVFFKFEKRKFVQKELYNTVSKTA